MTGYLRFHALARDGGADVGGRCRIEVQQLVDTAAQEEFMEVAWTMVLGRCKAGIVAATNRAEPRTAPGPSEATAIGLKRHRHT